MDDLVQLECQLDLEIQTYKDQVRVQGLRICATDVLKHTHCCHILNCLMSMFCLVAFVYP